jgi:hypothetical protein
VRKKYQRQERKSNHKFEVVRGQELLVRVPLPMAEVWAEMQAQVEELTGQAGMQIASGASYSGTWAIYWPRSFGLQGRRNSMTEVPAATVSATASTSQVVRCLYVVENMVDVTGLEPVTPCLQSRCSPN